MQTSLTPRTKQRGCASRLQRSSRPWRRRTAASSSANERRCLQCRPLPTAEAVERQLPVVVVPQLRPVGDREDGDVQLLAVLVDHALRVDRHRARALVQNAKFGLVVEETGHGDALLLAAREDVLPLAHGVPSALAADEIGKVDHLHELLQVRVQLCAGRHVQRIGDLVLQATRRKVRRLRNVEEVLLRWLRHRSAAQGPQASDHAEQARLARTVRAGDEYVGALLHSEAEVLDEEGTGRGEKVDVLEADLVSDDDLGRAARRLRGGGQGLHGLHILLAVEPSRPGMQHLQEPAHADREPRQVLDALVREDEVLACGAECDEETGGGDVVLHDLGCALALEAVEAEVDGWHHEAIGDHGGAVLDDVLVEHAHADAQRVGLVVHPLHLCEALVEDLALALSAAVEGNLLRVRDHAPVVRPKRRLLLLAQRSEHAEARHDPAQVLARKQEEGEEDSEVLAAHEVGEGPADEDDLEHGLEDVAVGVDCLRGEALALLRRPAVHVLHLLAEVRGAVVDEVAQVQAVAVARQALADRQRQLRLLVVQQRVCHCCRNAPQPKRHLQVEHLVEALRAHRLAEGAGDVCNLDGE
mmetsp:Transcript_17651/g.68515  ORF Transcript_17651/g.68515 Transcript_17651/m.68515 type:complete len:586 (+) Transcript_17651:2604-4361(+)